MITRKVFVFIQGDTVKCHHNLRKLAKAHNLPYFSMVKTLKLSPIYRKGDILVAKDIIEYKTARRPPNRQ